MNEISAIEAVLYDISAYVVERYGQRDSLVVSTKASPTDFLTEVDITVQKRIVEQLMDIFPADVLIGEESGLDYFKGSPPSRCWMVDPIDGTQNFLRGLFPEFGVSIGFLVDGNPVAGGVLFPVSQDLFLAERGSGTFRNGKRIHVSQVASLEKARVDIDFGASVLAYVDAMVVINNENYYRLSALSKYVSLLKFKHYSSYGFNVGDNIECKYIGIYPDGTLKLEPINPHYKIGEIYQFKIEDFEEVTDIENDSVIIAEVMDINQKKCGVKLPNTNYYRGQIINCKVIGYRKGRPQLEIVL